VSAFSPDGYRRLLEAIRAGGYRLRGFDVAQPLEQMLLLRHDVDMSLEDAVAMAEIEAEFEIRATYLLMTRSVFYNLASPAGLAAAARLRELGHWVGHHALHPHAEPTTDPGFDRVMAWHNPDPAYMADAVPGWVNVMEPRFTGDFAWTYRSDSNQTWRRGDPVEELAAGRFPWLQLLIHPVLWMGGVDGMPAVVERFLDRDRAARHEHLRGDNLGL
jgi:hypothetical protein